jgi:hypothetical protein
MREPPQSSVVQQAARDRELHTEAIHTQIIQTSATLRFTPALLVLTVDESWFKKRRAVLRTVEVQQTESSLEITANSAEAPNCHLRLNQSTFCKFDE